MAEALLSVLLKNLNTLILEEFGLLWGVDKDMKKLISELSAIQAVLEDAEEKQLSNRAIRDWLRKLKHAAYELDDILDDCSTEALKWEYKRQSSGSLKKVATSLLIYPVEHTIFLHKIGTRMKAITEELSAIAEERYKYNLQVAGSVADKRVELAKSRETSSKLTESLLLGRDEDKEKIIKVLVEDVCDSEDLSVYPIVGMGGLGKTTLTQMVFNDDRVESHFEPRIWVYVSQDFDSKRLIKTIIESVSGEACEVLHLDFLERRLRELLNEKRYLIALDDVWNENREELAKLKSALAYGAKGASLIVSTRLPNVAEIIKTVPPHHLAFLSEDDCWVLFKQQAFDHENEVPPNLEAIGKEIAKKCGGVPLAAKAIGGLLHCESEKKWLSVKDSEIWNLSHDDISHDENTILPALRLSYINLPLELSRCFAYCAIFPKGSKIGKEEVIHLWMANGYVSGRDGWELEDIGEDIWNKLLRRALFEVVDGKRYEIERTQFGHKIGSMTKFKMHDLLHDLAGSVMKEDQITVVTQESSVMFNERFHCVPITMLLQENHKARFPFRRDKSNIKKFGSLRVVHKLHSRGPRVRLVPSLIGNLKHLRYLDISRSYIKQLPDSICGLWNLQTLILNYCRQLERLPKNMTYLRGLRHLYLTACPLSEMPPKIGQLTCLKTLSLFVVGKSIECCQLAELRCLNLGGKLCIKHLERVRSPTDAKANLEEKENLCFLKLSWGSIAESESQENVEEVLEALEPHPNLKGLIIKNYGGTRLPLWRRNSILENIDTVVIEVIELINCKNCFQLPPLGQLPLLGRLKIEEMDKVEYIDGDVRCEGPARGFPSLEKLEISRLPNLKGLSREEGRELLPRLCEIEVRDCPKLRFPCLSSPKVLKVSVSGGCTNVVLNSISNLNSLTSLTVLGNEEVICFPKELLRNLTLLESLSIEGFSKLKMLPDELARFGGLKSLYISRCPELVAFPEGVKHLNSLRHLTLHGGGMHHDTDVKSVPWLEGLQHIPALESLCIWSFYEITSLPDWLGNLTSLQSLRIWYCPKIASLPASIQGLTKLNELRILSCSPELERRCQRGTGEDWDKIKHVPRVRIE